MGILGIGDWGLGNWGLWVWAQSQNPKTKKTKPKQKTGLIIIK